MISTIILTRNEEDNLPRCLAALKWCDDIVVIDSFSTDRTREIAESAGARVLTNRFRDFSTQRNFGVERGSLRYDWVLHVDADEEVTPELKDELLTVALSGRLVAYRVASKLMFQGKWLRYSGLYPSYQVRFGRTDRLRFQEVGHGQRETIPPNELGTLRNSLLHHNFSKGISEWFDRHNRYSSAEAQAAGRNASANFGRLFTLDPVERRRTLKNLASSLPCRPLLRFLYMYCLRLGFLDGPAGYTYCRLLAIYEYMIVLKSKERRPLQPQC